MLNYSKEILMHAKSLTTHKNTELSKGLIRNSVLAVVLGNLWINTRQVYGAKMASNPVAGNVRAGGAKNITWPTKPG